MVTNGASSGGAPLACQSTWIYMAPGRHTNGAPWPILMAHPRCAISIPDTNGAPGGAPLVKITNGVLLMAHHRCAINGHTRCAISRGFSSSAPCKTERYLWDHSIGHHHNLHNVTKGLITG